MRDSPQDEIASVVFDLDGTIADTVPMIVECLRQVLRKCAGREYSDSEIISMFGPTESAIIASHVPRERVNEAVEYFYETYSNLLVAKTKLFDGVEAMLRDIRLAGKRLALVTGKGTRSTMMTLRQFGVERYFAIIVTGDDVPDPKPSPQGLLRALRDMGSDPRETLYIGDTPADVTCGKAAGVLTGAALWGTIDRDGLLRSPAHFKFETPSDVVRTVRGI